MTDITFCHLARISICSLSGNHTEALVLISKYLVVAGRLPNLLECSSLSTWDIVNIKTPIVDKMTLWSSISDLWDTFIGPIL